MASPGPDGANPPIAPFREATGSLSDTSTSGAVEKAGVLSEMGNTEPPLPPLSASWRDEPLSSREQGKVHHILRACRDHDLDELRELATSEGGLVGDELRRVAWPILLGVRSHEQHDKSEWRSLKEHGDEHQIELDVNRSFVHYPEGEPEKQKDARKHELSNVITATLRQHPVLHYFQGYHDIVQVLLLVLGADAAVPAVARLSLLRIRDFMLPTMAGTQPHLELVKVILYAVDPDLAMHLAQTQPFFALPATLTLYAHDIEVYGDIARLFDFLLASEAVVSLYLYAVIITTRKAELLDIEPEEPDMLFAILSKLPKPLELDDLIRRTSDVFKKHPPESLPAQAWRSVSANSVLKTTHKDPQQLAKQSLADGEKMFERHAAEISRAEAWKKQKLRMRVLARRYRRPATFTIATVLVAVLAISLKRSEPQPILASWASLLLNLSGRTTNMLWSVLVPTE